MSVAFGIREPRGRAAQRRNTRATVREEPANLDRVAVRNEGGARLDIRFISPPRFYNGRWNWSRLFVADGSQEGPVRVEKGRGLITLAPIKRGLLIPYTGQFVTQEELDLHPDREGDHEYGTTVTGHRRGGERVSLPFVIDANPRLHQNADFYSVAGYANEASPGETYNACFVSVAYDKCATMPVYDEFLRGADRFLLIAVDLGANEEIRAFYGADYHNVDRGYTPLNGHIDQHLANPEFNDTYERFLVQNRASGSFPTEPPHYDGGTLAHLLAAMEIDAGIAPALAAAAAPVLLAQEAVEEAAEAAGAAAGDAVDLALAAPLAAVALTALPAKDEAIARNVRNARPILRRLGLAQTEEGLESYLEDNNAPRNYYRDEEAYVAVPPDAKRYREVTFDDVRPKTWIWHLSRTTTGADWFKGFVAHKNMRERELVVIYYDDLAVLQVDEHELSKPNTLAPLERATFPYTWIYAVESDAEPTGQ